MPTLDVAAARTFRAANATGNIAFAPYKLNFAAGRALVGGVSKGAIAPAARAASAGSAALRNRGVAAVENGRPAAGIYRMAGASTLGRVGSALETSAYAGRVIQQGGIFGRTIHVGSLGERLTAAHPVRLSGLLNTARAYRTLDLPFGRTVSAEELEAARQGASVRAWGTDLPTSPGRLTPLGYLGHETANAVRQNRVAKAYDVVLADQVLRGGIAPVRPALAPGADVTPAQRAGTEEVIARSTPIEELTPAQLGEVNSGGRAQQDPRPLSDLSTLDGDVAAANRGGISQPAAR